MITFECPNCPAKFEDADAFLDHLSKESEVEPRAAPLL
jgi:hypothetical protein